MLAAMVPNGVDPATAKIMQQLLNRGKETWGQPVESDDDALQEDDMQAELETRTLIPNDKNRKEGKQAVASVTAKYEEQLTKDKKKPKKKKKKKQKKKKISHKGVKEFTGFGTHTTQSKTKAVCLTQPPQSNQAFESVLQNHRNDESCKVIGTFLIDQVDPGNLRKLLSTGLSNEGLTIILKVFEMNLLPQHAAYVIEFLQELAGTSRFKVMVMMMTNGDIQRLGRIWEIIGDKTFKAHPRDELRNAFK
jgi:hypothetical protein